MEDEMSAGTTLMTTEELLALPDDGVQRWLIRGELREGGMTQRNRWHTRTEARFAQLLGDWLDTRPEPRGEIFSGEAGVVLTHDPDTTVGIDLVYVSAEVAGKNADDTQLIDGVPILAVEILSPSTKEEESNERIRELLAAGTHAVWIVDPYFHTITIYSRERSPRMFSGNDVLASEPYLPNFSMPVVRFFTRASSPPQTSP
jgi:Uma2 family endonuclease